MKRNSCYIALLMGLAAFSLPATAQDEPATGGGIRDARVVVEKDKVLRLRHVGRRFMPIVFEAPEPLPMQVNFRLPAVADSLPPLQVIVRPRTMKDLPLERYYGLAAKIGYGNYQSPYIMLNAGTKRNDEYLLNAGFLHYSSGKGPVLDNFSSAGITRTAVNGVYFFNKLTLEARAGYRYQVNSIYGYDTAVVLDPLIDFYNPQQRLNMFGLQVRLSENNLKNSWDYQSEAFLNHLTTNFGTAETRYGLLLNVATDPQEVWSFRGKLDFTGYAQQRPDSSDFGRLYIRLQPVAGYRHNNLYLKGGVNAVYENDPLSENGRLRLFPVVRVRYRWAPDQFVRLAVTGGVEKQALYDLYDENPWLSPNVQVNGNVNTFTGRLELQGLLASQLGYRLGYAYQRYSRQMFFLNNPADTARFDLVYDLGGSSVSRFFLRLDYLAGDFLTLTATGAYNRYATTDLPEAWHRPQAEAEVSAEFTIIPALRGQVSYFMLAGIRARDSGGNAFNLDPVHDINLGLNLSLTERAGLFVELLNILGSNYRLYNNYPVKGFQVLGGFSFKL